MTELVINLNEEDSQRLKELGDRLGSPSKEETLLRALTHAHATFFPEGIILCCYNKPSGNIFVGRWEKKLPELEPGKFTLDIPHLNLGASSMELYNLVIRKCNLKTGHFQRAVPERFSRVCIESTFFEFPK
ncbi:MAG TPA: hypothetical protein VMG59_09935 [Phycisphaerae bacterium]|nr:hypothetical protein [Phycisphaerae bacterium]